MQVRSEGIDSVCEAGKADILAVSKESLQRVASRRLDKKVCVCVCVYVCMYVCVCV